MIFSEYQSIVEPFWEHVRERPSARAMVFVGDDDSETAVTYGQLHQMAMVYAGLLKAADLRPEQTVFIALPHSLDLLAAFLGTLYQGGTPSIFPYLVPRPHLDVFVGQIQHLVEETAAGAVFVSADQEGDVAAALAGTGCLVVGSRELAVEDFSGEMVEAFPEGHTSGEQNVYLQFTSGTTGMRKGVQISHRAVLNFVENFKRALEITADDVLISWMPLYHDFGLFAGLLLPLLVGFEVVILSPFKWTRRPKKFFELVGKYGGTMSYVTSSGLSFYVRSNRNPEESGFDLSSLRVLLNGAEPIYLESQEAFVENFKGCGFDESAMMAGYGLAENTLSVSITRLGEVPNVDWVSVQGLRQRRAEPAPAREVGSQAVISCGVPVWGCEIRIMDEDDEPLPERSVGEVAIRTNSLFSGYYGRPELTAAVLREGWYYTGDLGYMVDGELYICGRKKDLIIVSGNNIYPEDLEGIANQIEGIFPDRTAAFGVFDEKLGTERVVMVADLARRGVDEDEKFDIERALRQRVYKELDVAVSEIHLMPRGWVVKTANGKMSRGANREKYLAELVGEG